MTVVSECGMNEYLSLLVPLAQEIARALGVSPSTVSKLAIKSGIEWP